MADAVATEAAEAAVEAGVDTTVAVAGNYKLINLVLFLKKNQTDLVVVIASSWPNIILGQSLKNNNHSRTVHTQTNTQRMQGFEMSY